MDQATATPTTPAAPLNRAARRAIKRAARPVHARARQPRQLMENMVEFVTLRATRLTHSERRRVMLPAWRAFQVMRTGVGTYEHWAALHAAVAIAHNIETMGVVKGLRGHMQAATNALAAIWQRATAARGEWQSTPLYFDELDSLREALRLHSFQLDQVAVSELHTAQKKATAQTLSAGGTTLTAPADSLPQPIQTALL